MIINFFNAKNGDAIHIETSEKKNIIFDMGYLETYTKYMKEHIIKINNCNQVIDLLIISHIDEDHINGAINFLKDIKRKNFKKEIIKEIWHNSYKHLNDSKIKNINKHDFMILKTLKEKLESEKNGLISNEDKQIKAEHGSTLAGLIYKLNIRWNMKAIHGIDYCNLDKFQIRILTPKLKRLETLKKIWRSQLLKLKYNFQFGEDEIFDDAYEFFLLNEDVKDDKDDKESKISSRNKKKFSGIFKTRYIYKK